MSSMRNVVRFEVFRTLKKKSFWYTSLAPPLIVLAVIGIVTASANSTGKSSAQQTQMLIQSAKMGVLDDTKLINTKQLAKQKILIEPNQQTGIKDVKSGKLDAFFYYPTDITKSGITIYSKDTGVSNTDHYDGLAQQILILDIITSLNKKVHNAQTIQILQKTPSVTDITYKNGRLTGGEARIIAPGVFMIAFLMLLVLLSYNMISSTTEEKENRAAEILLTSIKARKLIFGKILSIFILGFVQLVVILVPMLIYYASSSGHTLPGGVSLSHIPLDATAIIFGALFFISGFAMFTGWLVGFGSLFPSTQDAGRFTGLALLWAYIPIYALSYIISSPHSLIVTVLSYFPLTAPTTALLRNAAGTISTTEAFGVLAVIIASAALATIFAVRSFSYGAMSYSRRISIKELF
jgi:ABC-2 type transport system permease protein